MNNLFIARISIFYAFEILLALLTLNSIFHVQISHQILYIKSRCPSINKVKIDSQLKSIDFFLDDIEYIKASSFFLMT
jgi:hypothetical protein